jgi:hypothetical protein
MTRHHQVLLGLEIFRDITFLSPKEDTVELLHEFILVRKMKTSIYTNFPPGIIEGKGFFPSGKLP